MRFKKIIGIILALTITVSLSSCFKVTISVHNPNSDSAAANEDVLNTESAIEDSQSETAEEVTETDAEASESDSSEETSSEEETDAPAETTSEAPSETTTTAPATPDKMSNEELLKFFNSSLNRVKDEKVGFKKYKLTSILDLELSNSAANTLVGIVKNALLSDTGDETLVNKGESGIDVLSPSGKTYASNLTLSDITSIKCIVENGSYVIKVAVKGETNPTDGGTLSKVFDFMTVDDVVNIYAPKVGATVAKDDIEVVFSDCTATLTVDADGVVKAYSTYVKGVMNMYNASIKKVVTINTDLAITLASTTDYTDFKY